MGKTTWDKLSKWYSGMVGDEGSKFHQHTAIPKALELMNLQGGEDVLDVGCGNGVFSQYVFKEGARYTGMDSSKSFIREANRKYFKTGKFFVADALALDTVAALKDKNFDFVVFLLSISDMDPLQPIIKNVSGFLKESGKLIIFMTHPAFRIPRQSGWGLDENRGLIYRRIDRYLSEGGIPLDTKVGRGFVKSYFYHRPLNKYVRALVDNGLFIDVFEEIPTYKVDVINTFTKQEKRAYKEFPLFLAIRAVKMERVS